MKLSRRLIPAIAMLMVSAVLMSTASFAWFSMNSNVTATGIQVTADAPESSLLISSDNVSFGSTIDLPAENRMDTVLEPAAHMENSETFYTLTPLGGQNVDDQGNLLNGVQLGAENYFVTSTTDYLYNQFYLKLDSGDTSLTENIKVTATMTAGEAAIRNAIYILFVVTTGEGTTYTDMAVVSMANNNQALLTLTGGETAEVEIYVFVNGEHDDCNNASISADFPAAIDLTFSFAN